MRRPATKKWTKTKKDVLREAEWRCDHCSGPANHIDYKKPKELIAACSSCLVELGRTPQVPLSARPVLGEW
jgi:hypothetical protein